MNHVEWSNELKTGIEEVDLQHRQFVDFLNQFHEACQDRHKVRRVIDGLRGYVSYHFTFEESLMEGSGYRFMRAHKKVHELISKRLTEIHQRFNAGDDVTERLENLLSKCYDHIQNDDAAYVSVVKPYLDTLPGNRSADGWLVRLFRWFSGLFGVRSRLGA